jgi:hypothetical protein
MSVKTSPPPSHVSTVAPRFDSHRLRHCCLLFDGDSPSVLLKQPILVGGNLLGNSRNLVSRSSPGAPFRKCRPQPRTTFHKSYSFTSTSRMYPAVPLKRPIKAKCFHFTLPLPSSHDLNRIFAPVLMTWPRVGSS